MPERNRARVRNDFACFRRLDFSVTNSHTDPGCMGKNRIRRQREIALPTPFEEARDEMFQQIMQCGVIGCDPGHQSEWFDDTLRYLADRYPELTDTELTQLRVLGERFVQPPKTIANPVAATV